jgi:2-polyprenyl-3-methyl-5-hydroxy-6-metoxy-1,4-benzoquinol methylase
MDRHAHWQNVYATKAVTEVSWFQQRPELSLELIARAGVAPGTRIIDVGGGASQLVDILVEQGYQVTVLDIAEAALEKARARMGDKAVGVHWVAADVTAWRPMHRYDLWHDRAVFHFLTDEADRRSYAEAMAESVWPGGAAIVASFAPDGPERCSGLPICRYDAPALAREFSPAFELLESRREAHVTPAGKTQNFQYCLLRRLT